MATRRGSMSSRASRSSIVIGRSSSYRSPLRVMSTCVMPRYGQRTVPNLAKSTPLTRLSGTRYVPLIGPLPTEPTDLMNAASQVMPLGIEGFTYADLYGPDRLRHLHDEFCRQTAEFDPALWAEWDAYRTAPDEPRPAPVVSSLIVRMAPHVSRFVTRLFQVEMAAGEVRAHTHQLDPLFRFKSDFVRKRVLPLVKGGKHVSRDPADVAVVDRLAAPFVDLDGERAVAAA